LEIQASELQELLRDWAHDQGVHTPSHDIGGWLLEQGVTQERRRFNDPSGNRKQARFWIGVGIEDENHETEQINALP
jgi:hypothetical protein